MNCLQDHFYCLSAGLRRLRFSTLRKLACAATSGLLLGGCANSPASAGAGRSGAGADSVQPERAAAGSQAVAPLTRGDIPDAGNPAGIQLYAQTPEGIYLLVADHAFPSQRGWAGFGGAADPGETIAQTAARETEEETRGYFKRADLLEAIAGVEPLFDGKFAFYLVRVPMVPAEEITNHPIGEGDITFAERGPYAWVPYAAIEFCLAASAARSEHRACRIDSRYLPSTNPNTDWFWPVWLNNFRVARDAQVFPPSFSGQCLRVQAVPRRAEGAPPCSAQGMEQGNCPSN